MSARKMRAASLALGMFVSACGYDEVELPKASLLNEQSQPLTTYCEINRPGASAEEWISKISLGSIHSVSGASPSGYSDFTNQSTQLVMGQTVSMEVQVSFSWIPRLEHWKAWLDLNDDGVFNDAEFGSPGSERLFPTFDTSTDTPNLVTFQVPSAASAGAKRLRIKVTRLSALRDWQAPCFLANGEIEDYTVDLVSAPTVVQ